jgi:hypothetical protein
MVSTALFVGPLLKRYVHAFCQRCPVDDARRCSLSQWSVMRLTLVATAVGFVAYATVMGSLFSFHACLVLLSAAAAVNYTITTCVAQTAPVRPPAP